MLRAAGGAMAHDVFISYSNRDKAIADAVCARLEQAGHRCWIAPRDIAGGEWGKAIVEGIRGARLFIMIFSEHANRSPQVNREVERAVGNGLPIIPFRIEDVTPSDSLEYFISNQHWLDAMTPPLEQHLDHLVNVVGYLLTGTAPAPRPEPGSGSRPARRLPLAAASIALVAVAAAVALSLAIPRGTGADPAAIIERLGRNQTSERVQLHVDGRPAGGFNLTRANPVGRIEIAATGRSALYLIRGEEQVQTRAGLIRREFGGEGTIRLQEGARFCIQRVTSQGSGSDSTRVWLQPAERC